jgi:predicted nucleic acid-binding protein
MILVDTSVWVDHLRKGDRNLAALLTASNVLMHPFVIGELACGNLRAEEQGQVFPFAFRLRCPSARTILLTRE